MDILRTDTDHGNEYVKSIKFNGKNYGSCNPDGNLNECTYYDCSKNNGGHVLTKNTIQSGNGKIAIEIKYSEQVQKQVWGCPFNNKEVSVAARLTLKPGKINLSFSKISIVIAKP